MDTLTPERNASGTARKQPRYRPVSPTPLPLRTLAPGVSLRRLAKLLNVEPAYLSRIVNGKRGLTVRMARRIAKVLSVPIARVVDVLSPL